MKSLPKRNASSLLKEIISLTCAEKLLSILQNITVVTILTNNFGKGNEAVINPC
jgi:hypothetical protein